mmetsp:Transcript_15026/g.17010  ORF Transcript_15026/g.17010 Transcript_15026/m.17010 type:complete len:467 (+) Transcript_15026:176-1576(+)
MKILFRFIVLCYWLGCVHAKGNDTIKCWIQVGNDIDGRAPTEDFGWTTDISSDGLVLAGGSTSNVVRVFEASGDSFIQRGEEIFSSFGGKFGLSVSLSSDGSILAVTAAGNSTNKGFVRVLQFNGSSYVQRGDDIVSEDVGSISSRSSVSLSADGKVAAITHSTGVYSGHVRVYEYNGSDYFQRGEDLDGKFAYNQFGYSVALSSDSNVIAVGGINNSASAGHVRVFEYDGSNYVQRGQDIDGEFQLDRFGHSVSLSSDGSVLSVGAPLNDGNNTINSGHVRVFGYNGTEYVQRGQDIDGKLAGDNFGLSTSLSSDGSVLAVGGPTIGGPFGDPIVDGNGYVRIFQYDGKRYVQLGPEIEPGMKFFGISVSLNSGGNILAVGGSGGPGRGGRIQVYTTSTNSGTCSTESPTNSPTNSPTEESSSGKKTFSIKRSLSVTMVILATAYACAVTLSHRVLTRENNSPSI